MSRPSEVSDGSDSQGAAPSPAPTPGPVLDASGACFTLYSGAAEGVELCLFDDAAAAESRRLPMQRGEEGLWTVKAPGVAPGDLYGFRVHGPFDPSRGHRFNPKKIVIDPRAPALGRAPVWDARLSGHAPGPGDPLPDPRDNAAAAPLGRVLDSGFDWEDDRPPGIAWDQTVIYETHVKGLTARHPEVPEELRGSYLGMASEPVLHHLSLLGVTALELLPVHQKFDERHCHEQGLTNYWGYNPLLFFAPDVRFARQSPQDPAREFKEMVKRLHRAGLEVILDVVYNHTAEGDHLGPTLCYRGIDNAAYYQLESADPSRYVDFTGCGNAFNLNHPAARTLVLDSLRFWVRDMHVDGFRFDLAPVLGRGPAGFDPRHPFFQALREDPIFSGVKLIAEPWDLGADGYQLGAFPKEWSEWNDQYREAARGFWLGEPGCLASLARRLSASEDIFGNKGKLPRASINFITCHDGFTLQDLVSFQQKNNLANQENNRDGPFDNLSCNHGHEGPSDDPEIRARRLQHKRNLMATLLVSLGTPMLLGGDELGRTQQGNNNAWCQDNEISWYDWNLGPDDRAFLEFTCFLIELRRRHPVLRGTAFFTGRQGATLQDVAWLHPEGRELTEADWHDPERRAIQILIAPEGRDDPGSALLIMLNAGPAATSFVLPQLPQAGAWMVLADTHYASPDLNLAAAHQDSYRLQSSSLAILEYRP
ncbi:MAG: glycogen debranching protein GlgX [Nitrospinaceae bacterium]